MRESYNSYELKVQETFKQFSGLIGFSIIILGLLSVAYIMFWVGAVNDEYMREIGAGIFNPLASLVYGENITTDTYQNMAIFLFGCIFPVAFLQYVANKIQGFLIKEHVQKEEKEEEKRLQKAQKKYQCRYDGIKMYSICLSIDYESEKGVSLQNKMKLNTLIFSKIKSNLKLLEPKGLLSLSDVLVFSSDNFSKYDIIYDTILSSLSTFKKNIENSYKYKMIPSITTDAYENNFKISNIRQNHFEIQSFNFKNKALSTATFAKKYKHLKQKKYLGIPIGEYAYFKENSTEMYELNVIHKNLERQLSIT